MRIDDANTAAVGRMTSTRPQLVTVARATDVVPGMREGLLLHAGPPIEWERMSGPLRGAVVGALLVNGNDEIMLIADSGKLVRTGVDGISVLSRNTQGVKLISLAEGERLVGLDRIEEDEEEDLAD